MKKKKKKKTALYLLALVPLAAYGEVPPTETLYKCVDTKGVVHYTDDPTRNPACPAYRPGSPYPTIDYTDESMREAQKKLLELMMRSAKH